MAHGIDGGGGDLIGGDLAARLTALRANCALRFAGKSQIGSRLGFTSREQQPLITNN
jgi:hypothetical protein